MTHVPVKAPPTGWTVLCIHALPDGQSRLVDIELPVTRKVENADGSSHWEGIAPARVWGLAGGGSTLGYSAWHTCGEAGLSITLRGRWQIEASDGECRELGPGDVLVMLDTSGQGHRSWPQEGEDAAMVMGIGFGEGVEAQMRARLAHALAARD
ncbi:hypothetical protein HT136_14350 [Novosphingobium profundi]|uniref:hypothetical protein n=1 Tax=Novosphingobium profundi TaxID=1774954 RepID=UPI001BD9EE31|nr:hypothetical protein [Novosphingobium profundi]MBT0669548.1 hypothetical protein [Novosphingobium profundi]